MVRGHDQTHGYGGQALVVNLETGEVEKVQQGSDPIDFGDYIVVPELSLFVAVITGVVVAVGTFALYYWSKS